MTDAVQVDDDDAELHQRIETLLTELGFRVKRHTDLAEEAAHDRYANRREERDRKAIVLTASKSACALDHVARTRSVSRTTPLLVLVPEADTRLSDDLRRLGAVALPRVAIDDPSARSKVAAAAKTALELAGENPGPRRPQDAYVSIMEPQRHLSGPVLIHGGNANTRLAIGRLIHLYAGCDDRFVHLDCSDPFAQVLVLQSIAANPRQRITFYIEESEGLLNGAVSVLNNVLNADPGAVRLVMATGQNPEALPARCRAVLGPAPMTVGLDKPDSAYFGEDGHSLSLREVEGRAIRNALHRYRGRMSETARRLGIGRSTLYRKLSEFGLEKSNLRLSGPKMDPGPSRR